MDARSPSVDLDALASSSAGIVTRSRLIAAGWSEGKLLRGMRSGSLIPITPGVYRVRGAPWTRLASRHAALAIAGPGAVLADWSAAEVLGFAAARPGPIRVLVPHGRRTTAVHQTLVTIRRTRRLDPTDLAGSAGVPTTAPARTLLDLAPSVEVPALAELTTEAIRRAGLTLQDVERILRRSPRVPGGPRLREVLRLLDDDGDLTRSVVEVTALAALLDAGLPRPQLAYIVRSPEGAVLAEVDLAYPEHRLAIEIDGYRWHSSPARKRADEERQNRLVLAGWTVLRFSAAVVRAQPEALVASVARALRDG